MARHNGLIGSLALATILAAGVLVAWGFAATHVGSMIEAWFPKKRVVSEGLIIRDDGTPVIVSSAGDEDGPTSRTLDGKCLGSFNARGSRLQGSSLDGPAHEDKRGGQLGWPYRFVQLNHANHGRRSTKVTRTPQWYFVHDGKARGHGYFANCGEGPGYIARDGFQRDKPPLERQFSVIGYRGLLVPGYLMFGRGGPMEFRQYASDGTDQIIGPSSFDLLTEDGLVQIDLEERSVKVLRKEKAVSAQVGFEGPIADGVYGRQVSPANIVILFRTADRIRVLSFNGQEQDAYLLPDKLRDHDLALYRLSDGNLLIQVHDAGQSDQTCQGNGELFWLTRNGEIVRREKVMITKSVVSSRLRDNIAMSFVVPSPGAIAGFIALNPWSSSGQRQSSLYWIALYYATFDSAWPCLLSLGAVSFAFAILCYRRQRKYGLPWTGVWTGFVLLFGLPAYLGYLAHRTWPARLPCPNCGKLAPRDRPACLACGKDFPTPALKGLEVFAR